MSKLKDAMANSAKIKIAAKHARPALEELAKLVNDHPSLKLEREREEFESIVPQINQHLRYVAGEGLDSFGTFRFYHLCKDKMQIGAFRRLLKEYFLSLGLVIENEDNTVKIPLGGGGGSV